MQTVIGIENFQRSERPLYLALGNFDGVHKGHQSLIKALVDKVKSGGGQSVAFIFEPHPAQVLVPDKAPRLLLTPCRKAELLEKMGLDVLIYSPFTLEIAAWSPEQFVNKILLEKLQVEEVFVGFNYTFGHRGAGTPEDLQRFGQEKGFDVNVIAPVTYQEEPISSSLIRKALDHGDISRAYNMLGYYPIIEGVVVEGEHRGSAIGFPTANIGVEPVYHVPGNGVYAARACVDGREYHCVANVGSKPTFHQEYPISIEAHLMDFSRPIYGSRIKLSLLEKLRDERRFASLEELIVQIGRDRDKAWEISKASSPDL